MTGMDMSYCIKQDLIDRYGEDELIQLTWRGAPVPPDPLDPTPDPSINDASVTRACADATAVIDSYARGRYVTPLVTANQAVVKPFACAIARWLLHEDGHPEHVEHGYKAALDWLKDLSYGRVGLPDLTPPGAPGDSTFGVAVCAPTPVFTSARLGTMP